VLWAQEFARVSAMSMRPVSVIALLAIGVVLSDSVSGQEQPLYRSHTRTVPVYATVVDTRGRLVPDLGQADFSITDNGKAIALSMFSNDPQPFTAVVMLDTSARWVLRAGEDRRLGSDIRARRRGTAKSIPARIRTSSSGRQNPHPGRPCGQTWLDRPLSEELYRGAGGG